MSEIDELRAEIAELKEQVEALGNLTRTHLKSQQRQIGVVYRFLSLFNSRPWVPFAKDFGLWAQDAEVRLEAEEAEYLAELNRKSAEFSRELSKMRGAKE